MDHQGEGPVMTKPFQDRAEAGRILAGKLAHFADRPEVLVLGLPRGGVPVAFEVACALGVPLDVFLVRKLGVPGREELAMGAIAGGASGRDISSVRRSNSAPAAPTSLKPAEMMIAPGTPAAARSPITSGMLGAGVTRTARSTRSGTSAMRGYALMPRTLFRWGLIGNTGR